MIHRWIAGFLLSVCCHSPLWSHGNECVAARYRVVALPLRPAALNRSQLIAGTSAAHRAALWKRDTGLQELPLPQGYAYSEAVGINSSGDVIGNLHSRDFLRQAAFFYAHGTLTLLTGDQTRAYSINDAGVIGGAALAMSGHTTVPVIWEHNLMRPQRTCCAGSVTGINRLGHTVGDLYDERGRFHAFLSTNAQGAESIGPAERYSTAIALNDKDHVIVQTFPAIFLYADAALRRLTLHPRFPSTPLAINNCDVIVGAFGPFSDANRAFVWNETLGFTDLNSLIPRGSGWKLETATAIGDDGVIVGRGDHDGADDAGFMLLPQR